MGPGRRQGPRRSGEGRSRRLGRGKKAGVPTAADAQNPSGSRNPRHLGRLTPPTPSSAFRVVSLGACNPPTGVCCQRGSDRSPPRATSHTESPQLHRAPASPSPCGFPEPPGLGQRARPEGLISSPSPKSAGRWRPGPSAQATKGGREPPAQP